MAAHELKYTAEEIDGILESVDEKTIYDDATQSEHGLMSTADKAKLDALPTGQQIGTSLNAKVDKVEGKGLSKNDYTDEDKASVASAYHKPQNGIPKTDFASDVQTSLGKADTALQSETDPTVPSWAKQQNKPSYNYSEIGNTPDLSQFVTKTVNDLTNYYLKSETYTKAEVAALIGAIQQFHYEIYATLPQSGESNVLYLIGPTGTGSDRYEEYVYSNNAFTKIGDTSIDLNGYVTTSALNTALESYVSSSDLSTALAAYTPTSQLAEVATSGSYNDLSDKPTIPTITIDNTLSDSSENPVQNKVVKAALNLKADKNVTPTIIIINGIENLTNEQLANLETDDIVLDSSLINYYIPYIVNRISISAIILYSFSVTEYSIRRIIFSYYKQYGFVLSSRTTEFIERTSKKVTAFQSTPDDTHYPSEKLVKDSLDTKYEKPNGGIPSSDLASGVIPDISGKADKTLVVSLVGGTATQELADNTIYQGTTLSSLTITIPNSITSDYISQINFTSGSTATTFTAPNTIKWFGDDLTNDVFVPVVNSRYIVIVYSDGVNIRGTVQSYETTV